jgi:hypothetical protein
MPFTRQTPAVSGPAAAAAASSASNSCARATGSVYALKYGTYQTKNRRIGPVHIDLRSSSACSRLNHVSRTR